MKLIETVRAGDKVTITNRFGQLASGKAIMPCIAGGWVLNMGGKFGTPGIANDANVVRVTKTRRRRSTGGIAASWNPSRGTVGQ